MEAAHAGGTKTEFDNDAERGRWKGENEEKEDLL
jgi:hypothetical protein